jgi:NtrC-family two-component system sensor histidine kinase KinB
MNYRPLKTSFILAGALMVATTVVCGLWSWMTFLRLSRVMGSEIQTSKVAIELATELSGTLEREDDALLLLVPGAPDRGSVDLGKERGHFDQTYERLIASLNETGDRSAASDLRQFVADYRRLGDLLLSMADLAGARDFYHKSVNPALRRAVGACAKVRELNLRSIENAGIAARDEAERSTWIVLGISVTALVISCLVTLRLARSVVGPITDLSRSVEAVRAGRFESRVSILQRNELGRLAEGFNRMAEGLAEFHRLNVNEVLRAKERLESTLSALPDAVFLLDSQGVILSTSPLARRMMGSHPERIRRIDGLDLPADCLGFLGKALRGETAPEAPMDLAKAVSITWDGRTRSFLPRVLPVSGGAAGHCGAVVVFYDVTEFAKLDELRTEMVAVASHELRTPLTTLRMNLLLLEESLKGLSGVQREILNTALFGCRELHSTVDELLDLGRIEAGQLRLNIDRIEVNALMTELVTSLNGRFEGANILLDFQQTPDSVYVRGDAARLRIALSNLLDNALKYTPAHGSVWIRISRGKEDPQRSRPSVSISISDTGPGIGSEFRERIFEKFFRVEHHVRAGKTVVGGAGIGLYLTRQIIAAHGGRVWCESEDGGTGSRFVVALDVDSVSADGGAVHASAQASGFSSN